MADSTIRIYNEFYNVKLSVSANEYEIVNSFFRSYTSDEKVAVSYTEILFRISNQTDIDVLTLLDSFQTTDSMKVTLTMAYYLNSLSDKTVLYGINNIILPNQVVQRNIIQ
jgi:hypothetical protein